jgi:hypothetical protein
MEVKAPLFNVDVMSEYSGWEVGDAMANIMNRMIEHYNTHIVHQYNLSLEETK